ncbi:hypothetical protein ACFQL8_30680 [Streptomyces goshikiensis]|uniref:hypothetical protein n=2 Tax=Streptomyces goshikiensis TaxID=1942 RepID=UPI001679588F|nr:hypothetical protein [Streptomyces goshikiensis]
MARSQRALDRKIRAEQARPVSERYASARVAEEEMWERFLAADDQRQLLTRFGVAAVDMLPSARPDGSPLTEEALDIYTGISRGAKKALDLFEMGELTDAEMKEVVMTAFRLLTGLGTWNQALCYTALSVVWSNNGIKLLREKGQEKTADAFQRGLDLIHFCHQQLGHTMLE